MTLPRKSVLRLGVGLCAAAVLVGSTGCYKRVIGARGFGADRVGISDPNVSEPRGDRTLGYPTYTPRRMPGG